MCDTVWTALTFTASQTEAAVTLKVERKHVFSIFSSSACNGI